MNEQEIESKLVESGKTAPRLSPKDIDAVIAKADYHVFPGTTVTVCCLTLQNGFNVVGESAAVSPENFDADIGKEVAFNKARDKVWALEGYLLKQRLFEQP